MSMATLTIPEPVRWKASSFRDSGRIPSKLRECSIRRASGRAWKQLSASDEAVAVALGIDRRNAATRRAGEAGPFAGVCVEAYRLESAEIATYALTAHLNSIAMMPRLRTLSTETLFDRLDELQTVEQEKNAALDAKQMRYLLREGVCLREFRDRAAAQAAVSEEIVAILDELEARRTGQ